MRNHRRQSHEAEPAIRQTDWATIPDQHCRGQAYGDQLACPAARDGVLAWHGRRAWSVAPHELPREPSPSTSLELADQGLAGIPSRKDSPTAPPSSDAVP